jgi:hypothetical protein
MPHPAGSTQRSPESSGSREQIKNSNSAVAQLAVQKEKPQSSSWSALLKTSWA